MKPKVQRRSGESRYKDCERLDKKIKQESLRQPRETGKWPSSRQANSLCDQDDQIPGPTPRLQQRTQRPQRKETQHSDGQLIGSTLGVQCHVKTDTGTRIRANNSGGERDTHARANRGGVHTEFGHRQSGVFDYRRNSRSPPQSTSNKSEDRNPQPRRSERA